MSVVDILLPTPLSGSGGLRTVIVNAESLAARGHTVRLHVQTQRRSRRGAEKTRAWFPVSKCQVRQGWPQSLPDSDAVMATTWFSAPVVAALPSAARRLYFVQDYEPLFHPAGDLSVAAAGSYRLGLQTLVIGSWLQHKLHHDHAVDTARVPFTADLDTYRPDGHQRRPQVVAIYQPDKPRRCPDLVRKTLTRVLAAGLEVVTVGARPDPRLGRGHRHLGMVDVDTLADLYRSSAAGLCVSASNPSRVPFEMMACGLPVVEAHLPNTVFDFPEGACLLARPDPAAMAAALVRAAAEPERGELGVRYMQPRPAAEEQRAFARFVEAAVAGEPTGTAHMPTIYRQEPD